MLKWLWLSLLILLADQVTKHWVVSSMRLYETVELLPFFQLTHVRNEGAAFSFLSDAGGWQRWLFVALALVASGVIVIWLLRLSVQERWQGFALALILGGALGNLTDRIRYGYVVDFIDVFYRHWHWPAFNVADSAISVGVAMLALDLLRTKKGP